MTDRAQASPVFQSQERSLWHNRNFGNPAMRKRILASFALLALLSSGCASHDSATGTKPEAEIKTQLRATIASVQLIQNCPDPQNEPSSPAVEASGPKEESAMQQPASESQPAPGARAARLADSDGSFQQPCTQSTMQLSIGHDAPDAQRVQVVGVRLLRGTEVLGTIDARKPSKWNDSGLYDAWDERVPVGSEIKVSYRLGEPDWSKVQEKLGAGVDVYSQRYILEVDLKMGDTKLTVRSPEFAREYPHVVVT
jgi:hypothetical protein